MITANQIKTFQQCPRKHHLRYNERLQPEKKTDSQGRGYIGSVALRMAAQGVPAEEIQLMVLGQYQSYPNSSLQAKTLCSQVFAYCYKWRDWRLQTDSIGDTEIDYVEYQGDLYLVRHKFTSSCVDVNKDSNYISSIKIDPVMTYNLLRAREAGIDAKGYILDFVQKPSIKPKLFTLKQLQEIKESGDLVVYFVDTEPVRHKVSDNIRNEATAFLEKRTDGDKSKADILEDDDCFSVRLQSELLKDLDKYFARVVQQYTEHELATAKTEVKEVVQQMHNGVSYKNTTACYGLGSCEYIPICSNCLSIGDVVPQGFSRQADATFDRKGMKDDNN